MTLNETAIRNVESAEKPIKLFDGDGLYLVVTPGRGRYWRLKYRFGGKGKSLSFGVYPKVTLAAARNLRDEARSLLAGGVDPSEMRKRQRIAERDEAVRREAAMRFSVDSDGALSIRLSVRRIYLGPSETRQLRAFFGRDA